MKKINPLMLFKRECYFFKNGLELFQKHKNEIDCCLDDDFDETTETIINWGFTWSNTPEGFDYWAKMDVVIERQLEKYGSHFKLPCNCMSKFIEIEE